MATATAADNGSTAPTPPFSLEWSTQQQPPQQHYYRERDFGPDLGRDLFVIWTSPARIEKRDLLWLAPIGGATGVLIATDDDTSNWLADVDFPSEAISALGGPTNFATAAVIYSIGRATGQQRVRETGLLGLRATSNTWITVQAIKHGTNRQRPDAAESTGEFWKGGKSFPSGHSASTWALATVIAEKYPEKRALRIGMYSLASAVSFSRLSGERHFPSDVLVGGVVGHLIGRHVIRDWRSRRELMRLKAYQQPQG